MNIRSAVLLAAPALLLMTGGCKDQTVRRNDEGMLYLGAYESTDVVERVVSPGSRRLVLDGYSGSIRLNATNADVARLRVTRRARGDSPTEASANLGGLDIEEHGDEIEYRYHFAADKPELSRYDVAGEVPSATPLLISWTSGGIQLEGFDGQVDVQTANGDIGYLGASTKVRLQSRNGDVSATILARVPRSAADSLGPIPATEYSYELTTANGDVAASLPAALNLHIEASTSAGSIRTAEFPFVEEKYGPENAGARFSARLGTGRGRLKLATQHGSILLRETVAAPTRIEEPERATVPLPDSSQAGPTTEPTPTVPSNRPADANPSQPAEESAADSARASSN